MKRRVRYFGGVMALCSAIAIAVSVQRASAQNEAAPPSGKIAVFNRKAVFDGYKKRETEWKALEDEKTALQTEIDKLRDDVNAGKKKLRDDKTLTEQQKLELTDKVTADERNYEDKWRRAQMLIDEKSTKFFSTILGQIDSGAREYGAAQNYTMIVDSDPKAGTPVLYFAASIDITDSITKFLNSK